MTIYVKEDYLKPRHHPEDAGLDLRAATELTLNPGDIAVVPTGVSWEISNGHFAYITGRSSMNSKGIIVHQGVVDAGYRGEWKVVLQNLSKTPYEIREGDKIAQAVILAEHTHLIQIKQGEADDSTSFRGSKGFGSTGR